MDKKQLDEAIDKVIKEYGPTLKMLAQYDRGEINMKHDEFDKFLDDILGRIKSVLGSKSADYSTLDDKLYNFKLQARIDGITSMEALRGNWLKHRASICQGLDEMPDKVRPWEWWMEKGTDDINYCILMLAMLYSGEF